MFVLIKKNVGEFVVEYTCACALFFTFVVQNLYFFHQVVKILIFLFFCSQFSHFLLFFLHLIINVETLSHATLSHYFNKIHVILNIIITSHVIPIYT